MYEWVDNLHFIQDPADYVYDVEPYLEIAKAKFLEAGWYGSGEIGLIWLPPFMFKGNRTANFTTGVVVWHVKQKEDGISWLLTPAELPCENESAAIGNASQTDAYQHFADFIASLSPRQLLNYTAPTKMQQRVELLIERKREGVITKEESEEMERYFTLEHIVRLAKARALKLVAA
jgi:uncharacterized phage-like protein YoqJ